MDIGEGSHTPTSAVSLSEEITMLCKRVKEQDKEIRRLKEENEFPEEAHIPSERTVYWVMDQIGLSHRPKRKPNGITKADREAMKSDDLLKRDFRSDSP